MLHQPRDNAPRRNAFRAWLLNALRGMPAFEGADLVFAPSPLAANDFVFAARSPHTVVLWLCDASDDPHYGFQGTVARLYRTVRRHPALQSCRLVLASADDLSDPMLHGVDVVDAQAWLSTWGQHRAWAEGIAARLKRLLRRAARGSGPAAVDLGSVAADTMRFLFRPTLIPLPVLDGSRRRGRPDGLFAVTTSNEVGAPHWPLPGGHVVVEASATPFGRLQAVHQLTGYLDALGGPGLGVLVTSDEVGPDVFAALAAHARTGDRLLSLSAGALVALIDAQLAHWQGRAALGAAGGLEAIVRAQRERIEAAR